VRLGLVGYGVGGRYFHAPFIAAAEGVELAGVVTRSPARRAELAADFPAVPAYDSLADLLAAGVDAVTISTPPWTRRELVLEAVAAGVPTIDTELARRSGAEGPDRGQRCRAAPFMILSTALRGPCTATPTTSRSGPRTAATTARLASS
jgi:Oxidoreductase family, NAD-binding Rossmann fold